MTCMPKNPAVRRFYSRVAATTLANIALNIGVALSFYRFRPHGPAAYGLAILPAVAILGFIVAIGKYLVEDKDEFQRNLMVQVLLWGLGGVLVLTSAWGSLEPFAHIRHLNPSWTFTFFWIFVGISVPFLNRRYR